MPDIKNRDLRYFLRRRKLQYRGHGGQVIIYLGKLLRGFVYQSDWKVLPMAALIAGLVSMVVRRDFFLTMEGTLKGALALTCTSIWNGCFNSIQVVCREREIIKRDHRSGLHISAYIAAHMVYQGLICLAQTALTLYVCFLAGIQFPKEGLFTPLLIVDLGITIFLITYASDMLSLWLSSMTHNTTTAMTIMPFVLIFQLVFSGGVFTLPAWAQNFSAFSISNYGMKCVAAQAGYNELPLVTAWDSIEKVENNEVDTTITLGEALDFLSDDSKTLVHDIRENQIVIPTIDDLVGLSQQTDSIETAANGIPTLKGILELAQFMQDYGQVEERGTVSVGELIDTLASSDYINEQRNLSYSFSTTIGKIINTIGRDKVKIYVQEQTALASQIPAYERTKENIEHYWLRICTFGAASAFLAVVFLEFIDKDKR